MKPFQPRKILFFEALLTKKGWISNVYVTLDDQGCILQIDQSLPQNPDAQHAPLERVEGFAIPGFQNGHSHAFQYAMAGVAEHLPLAAVQDDFWTWREAMYALALKLNPEEMEATATLLYSEMLRHGITAVTEFHYLHHDAGGKQYKRIAEMGERILSAAKNAGIHVTLVPVMYEQGGFGKPIRNTQIRFGTGGIHGYTKLLEDTRAVAKNLPDVTIGMGIHSLRAVSSMETKQLLTSTFAGPIHLHVAEQRKEVVDCVATLGATPVQWLLDNLPVDRRFHLVHATHMTESEAARLGQSKATVIVCPSTEGNLGDGIFRLKDYRSHGGGCAFGTDSQIGISPFEELRWLDYVQRLSAEKRNVVCQHSGEDSGTLLLTEAWDRGRSAMGEELSDFFAIGKPFDAAIVDSSHPVMLGKPLARRIGSLIYGGDPTCLLGTIRRGQWLVKNGQHVRYDAIKQSYARAVKNLWL